METQNLPVYLVCPAHVNHSLLTSAAEAENWPQRLRLASRSLATESVETTRRAKSMSNGGGRDSEIPLKWIALGNYHCHTDAGRKTHLQHFIWWKWLHSAALMTHAIITHRPVKSDDTGKRGTHRQHHPAAGSPASTGSRWRAQQQKWASLMIKTMV